VLMPLCLKQNHNSEKAISNLALMFGDFVLQELTGRGGR